MMTPKSAERYDAKAEDAAFLEDQTEPTPGSAATNTDLALLVWVVIVVGIVSGVFLPH